MDRNLSPAAILADFFRKLFLVIEKKKGNETQRHRDVSLDSYPHAHSSF